MLESLVQKYGKNSSALWNKERDPMSAMENSDLTLSDFSGIVFDYFLLMKKSNDHIHRTL